jgi:hypothetical protein
LAVSADPVVPWWADWPLCQAAPTGTPGCIGGQLDPDQPCFAHSDDDGRAAAMRRLRDGISLDFLLGAEVTEALLAEVLAAAPTKDGRRVLPFVDLRGARFHSTAGFDGASFQGDAGFFGLHDRGAATSRSSTTRKRLAPHDLQLRDACPGIKITQAIQREAGTAVPQEVTSDSPGPGGSRKPR